MSTLIYAGSAQFILAGMYAGAPASAIILLYFVNLRHLLMSLAPYFMKLPLFKNLLIGSQITDETFGVADAQKDI